MGKLKHLLGVVGKQFFEPVREHLKPSLNLQSTPSVAASVLSVLLVLHLMNVNLNAILTLFCSTTFDLWPLILVGQPNPSQRSKRSDNDMCQKYVYFSLFSLVFQNKYLLFWKISCILFGILLFKSILKEAINKYWVRKIMYYKLVMFSKICVL